MGGFARGASPGFDAGHAPHSAAVRLVALATRFRAATVFAVAHDGVRGAILGLFCGLAVAVLLWQTFWHDRVDIGVAVGVSTLVAAVLLMVPMRAVAGAFALTLSLSIVGLSAFYFAAGGTAASADTAAVQDAETQEVGGSDPATELVAADPDPAVIDSQTDSASGSLPASSGGQRFGADIFDVPEASGPGREPVTPCHYRSRAWRSAGAQWSVSLTGPCSPVRARRG